MSICLVKQNDGTWVEKHQRFLFNVYKRFFYFLSRFFNVFNVFLFLFWNVFYIYVVDNIFSLQLPPSLSKVYSGTVRLASGETSGLWKNLIP